MCRWFAYISASEECLLEDVLINPPHSLAKQVNEHFLPKLLSHDPNNITNEHEIAARNRLLNVDGFGVAWYTNTLSYFNNYSDDDGMLRPAVYKNSNPPIHDPNFQSICANTSTTACFAHIRAATATPIVSVNNHPFIFGRHAIMHNGVVANFLEISRAMAQLIGDKEYGNIKGSTDSEHVAALYMTYLTANGDDKTKGQSGPSDAWEQQYTTTEMRNALSKAIFKVVDLQFKTLGHDNPELAANSLNIAVTDGQQVVACRFRNHSIEQPPSLYWSTTAGMTLNRKYPDHADGSENVHAHKKEEEHGSHVILASEPTTYKQQDWNLILKNHCIVVGKDGKPHSEDMKCPGEWLVDKKDYAH